MATDDSTPSVVCDPHVLVLDDRSAALRRLVGPAALVVLECLAARVDAAGIVSTGTTIRGLAHELAVGPDTVGRALQRLRANGVVAMERSRMDGRFAGTIWRVDLRRLDGVWLASPGVDVPGAALSDTAPGVTVDQIAEIAVAAVAVVAPVPNAPRSNRVELGTARVRARRPPAPSLFEA
jgi:DNA-binding transcriptional ArsR family regulator